MRYNLIMSAQGLSSELKEQVVLEVAGEGPDYRGGGEVLRAGSSDGGELGQEMEEGPPGVCRRGGILRAVGGEQEAARLAARGQDGDRAPRKAASFFAQESR